MKSILRFARLTLLASVLNSALGCYGENPAQILETAQFEELQRNEEHARELYERIITKFPNSEQAGIARTRLAELSAPAE